jgi:hypothetical protein
MSTSQRLENKRNPALRDRWTFYEGVKKDISFQGIYSQYVYREVLSLGDIRKEGIVEMKLGKYFAESSVHILRWR